MAAYKPWKELERRTAKRFRGVRLWRPDYSDSEPDGHNETDVWDCKALSRQAIVGLWAECEKKYRDYTGLRRFILVLFDPTRPRVGDLVVLHATRYDELLKKEKLLDDHVASFVEYTA